MLAGASPPHGFEANAHWRRDRFGDGPTLLQSAVKVVDGKSEPIFPIANAQGHAVVRDPTVVAFVSTLLWPSGPSDVAGFVPQVVVDSLDGVFR